MANVCLYLELHQPWRLNNLSLFDLDGDSDYFEIPSHLTFSNSRVFEKVSRKSYRPMLLLLDRLLETYQDFSWSLSISGVAFEQMKKFSPDLIGIIKKMVSTGRLELLEETYFHSLSALYSPKEFSHQVKMHNALMQSEFGYSPKVFRNTELIYTNQIAEMVKDLGYKGILAEGAEKILTWRKPTYVYESPCGLPVLTKHYKLSDDIAFRFGETSRSKYPLTSETFSHWINSGFHPDEVINLFMDFETFGEHQWEDTGIFNFFENFVGEFLAHGGRFLSVSQEAEMKTNGVYDSVSPVSWADVDRDITAWRGNALQEDTLNKIYKIEDEIIRSGDRKLIDDWRKLQTSDHFYYMCTKWSADGDVHAYFSPYGSPYLAYSNFNNVLADLLNRLFNRSRYGKSASIE